MRSSPSTPSTQRRSMRGVGISALALLLVAAVTTAAVVWWNGGIGPVIGRERCVVTASDVSVTLTPEQARNASTITLEALARGLPSRAVTVALATAYQESDLLNLPHGDRDSAGLFQQRPSQGWGTFDQITDPRYSAGRFYAALVQVPDWQNLAITRAAQSVQRSAFPDAYARHADQARVLAAAFTGDSSASVSCTVRADAVPRQHRQANGLTARANHLSDALLADFGGLPAGDVAAGDVTASKTSAGGRAVDVAVSGASTGSQRRHGWAVAHWLVAHADEFDISVVAYDRHVWTAARSPEGWRGSEAAGGGTSRRGVGQVHVEVTAGTV
ncbi:MAG: hypothetical protein WAN48_04720 [Actinomycetes bacterium]